METLTKKEMVQHFLDQGVLLTPDILEAIKGENFEVLEELCKKNNLMIINNEVSLAKDDLAENINWKDFESQLAEKEKGKRTSTMDITSQFKPVQVLFSYQDKGVKPSQ